MADRQAQNCNWDVRDDDGTITWERAGIAVLMDIRRELKTLNQILHCQNFLAIPHKLDRIRINTTRRKRRRKI